MNVAGAGDDCSGAAHAQRSVLSDVAVAAVRQEVAPDSRGTQIQCTSGCQSQIAAGVDRAQRQWPGIGQADLRARRADGLRQRIAGIAELNISGAGHDASGTGDRERSVLRDIAVAAVRQKIAAHCGGAKIERARGCQSQIAAGVDQTQSQRHGIGQADLCARRIDRLHQRVTGIGHGDIGGRAAIAGVERRRAGYRERAAHGLRNGAAESGHGQITRGGELPQCHATRGAIESDRACRNIGERQIAQRLGDRNRSRAHRDLAGGLAKCIGHGKAARPPDGTAALCVVREIERGGHIQRAAVHGQAAGTEIREVDRTGDAGIEDNVISRRNDDVRHVGEIRNRTAGPVGGIRPTAASCRPNPDYGSELSNVGREPGRLSQRVIECRRAAQRVGCRHGNARADIRRGEVSRLGQRHRVVQNQAVQAAQCQRCRGGSVIDLPARHSAADGQRRLRDSDIGQCRLRQHIVAGRAAAIDQGD